MKADSLNGSNRLTSWGRCRQAHIVGRNLLIQQRYTEALPSLTRGVDCSDNPWAWFDLGLVHYNLGDLPIAAKSWQHTPEGYEQAALFARKITMQGDSVKATAAWRFAAEINPNKQEPYIQIARLKTATEPGEVEALLIKAVEADPNSATAYIELGFFYRSAGDNLAAQHQFGQALALDPINISLLVTAAENAAVIGNIPEAIELWQEVAIRNDRRRGLAYFQIGSLAFQDNNFASALAFFKKAVEIQPENGQFLLGLAGAYSEIGCRRLAIGVYQNVLVLAEADALLEAAQLKLAELAVNSNDITSCPEES